MRQAFNDGVCDENFDAWLNDGAADGVTVADVLAWNAPPETVVEEFLRRTGRYVTNDASRDAAIAAAVAAEREACAAEIDLLKRERHHIYDLLARIHRDGGQYAAEHGAEKACDDAETQVVTWIGTSNDVDGLIEQARLAEREACAVVCIAQADRLEGPSDACGIALVCAGLILARTAT